MIVPQTTLRPIRPRFGYAVDRFTSRPELVSEAAAKNAALGEQANTVEGTCLGSRLIFAEPDMYVGRRGQAKLSSNW